MLELKNVTAEYNTIRVLHGISLKVEKSEFVALLGPNGVGKTTTLRAIAGMLRPRQGEIHFKGKSLNGIPPHAITGLGLSYITESGSLFQGMSVRENLILGSYRIKDKNRKKELLESCYELFPRLKEREKQLTGTLSGGERRMVAIARGMMSAPEMMLVDEPSLGLAPNLVMMVFETLVKLKEKGLTILLVEQNVNTTLKMSDRAYVLEQGQIILEGPSRDLLQDEHVKCSYLGVA